MIPTIRCKPRRGPGARKQRYTPHLTASFELKAARRERADRQGRSLTEKMACHFALVIVSLRNSAFRSRGHESIFARQKANNFTTAQLETFPLTDSNACKQARASQSPKQDVRMALTDLIISVEPEVRAWSAAQTPKTPIHKGRTSEHAKQKMRTVRASVSAVAQRYKDLEQSSELQTVKRRPHPPPRRPHPPQDGAARSAVRPTNRTLRKASKQQIGTEEEREAARQNRRLQRWRWRALRSNLYLHRLREWIKNAQQEEEAEDLLLQQSRSGLRCETGTLQASTDSQPLSATARLMAALEQHKARIRKAAGVSQSLDSLPRARGPRLPQVAKKVASVQRLMMKGQGGISGAQTERSSRSYAGASTARTPGSVHTRRSLDASAPGDLGGGSTTGRARARWVRSQAVMVLRPATKKFAEFSCEPLRTELTETIASSADLLVQFESMSKSSANQLEGMGVTASPGMRLLNSRGKSRSGSLRLAIPNADGTTTPTPRRQGPRSLLRMRREVLRSPARYLGDEFDNLHEDVTDEEDDDWEDGQQKRTEQEIQGDTSNGNATPLLRSVQRRRMKRMARALAVQTDEGSGNPEESGPAGDAGASEKPSPSPLQRYLPGVGRAFVKTQRVRVLSKVTCLL